MSGLTLARAREAFRYDDGRLLWKVKASRNTVLGSAAGCLNKGYLMVRVDGSLYGAHRIVWLLHHGSLPALDIDHINGVGMDNRIENLRLATRSENMQNVRRAPRNNKSGLLGASFCKQRRKWTAQICVEGKRRNLGFYASAREAHRAYLAAKVRLHPFQTIVK